MFAKVIVKMGLRFLKHIVSFAGLHLLLPTWAQSQHIKTNTSIQHSDKCQLRRGMKEQQMNWQKSNALMWTNAKKEYFDQVIHIKCVAILLLCCPLPPPLSLSHLKAPS